MIVVLNSLVPVCLLILVGFGLARYRLLSAEAFDTITRLVFWLGLPVLLFVEVATMPASNVGIMLPLAATIATLVVTLLLGMVWSGILRLPAASRAAMLHGAFRANLAFVGWPVVQYAFGALPGQTCEPLARAMLVTAPLVAIYNIVGIMVLLPAVAPDKRGRDFWTHALGVLVTNPLILACLLAIAWRFFDLGLPTILNNTLRPVGAIATPLSLLAIGASLATTPIRGTLAPALTTSLIRVAAGPAVAFAACRMLSLSPSDTRMILILMACPTAVASYIITRQMGGDEAQAGSTVALSTILSFASLGAVIYFTT